MSEDILGTIQNKIEDLKEIEEKMSSIKYRITQFKEALEQESIDIVATVSIKPSNITYSWFNAEISTDTLRIMSVIELEKLKVSLLLLELEYKRLEENK